MEDAYTTTDFNYCNFRGTQTEILYTCLKDEVCCDEGCCPKATYAFFRVWYFWFILVGLLFACSGGFKLCKVTRKPPANRARARSAARRRVREQSPVPPIPYMAPNLEIYFGSGHLRNSETVDDDHYISIRRLLGSLSEHEAGNLAIDSYIACQNAREVGEDVNVTTAPPPYSSVQKKLYSAYDMYGPPPQYNTLLQSPVIAGGDELERIENRGESVATQANENVPDGNNVSVVDNVNNANEDNSLGTREIDNSK